MTQHTSRQRPRCDRASIMLRTRLLALLPGIGVSSWFLGSGLLVNLLIAVLAGILFSCAANLLRRRSLRSALTDPGVPVTAILLALLLPQDLPFWLPIAGMAFAILLVQQVFGGTNQAVLHPAMSAYLLVLLVFPEYFTESFPGASIESIPAGEQSVQALLWINGSFLLGGLFLLQQRIVRWHIPLSLLVMLVLVSWIGTGLDTKLTGLLNGPLLTPFTGLTMLAAFFIATDFGSAAITPRGRLVYGALIGALLATTPPGATALAVTMVIANFCAPLIDQLCRPRIYGHAATIVNEEAR